MRCKNKGEMCKSCTHKTKSGGCTKSHWLDMIGIARGTKPKKSYYRYKFKRLK